MKKIFLIVFLFSLPYLRLFASISSNINVIPTSSVLNTDLSSSNLLTNPHLVSSNYFVSSKNLVLHMASENKVTSSSRIVTKLGYLNVFTDYPNSEIYVDGKLEGKDTLIKFSIEPGEHQIQIKQNEKLIYSKIILIQAKKTTSVVAEEFVDFASKTPSRGAIDREARRLRESRGNFAMGGIFSNTYPAASLKWWFKTKWALQGLFLGDLKDKIHYGSVGARILFSPGDRVFQDDVLNGYFYLGTGGLFNKDSKLNSYYDFGLGVEAKLGELANKLLLNRSSSYVLDNRNNDFLRDLFILGILNLFYTNLDINFFNSSNKVETEINIGMHVYF